MHLIPYTELASPAPRLRFEVTSLGCSSRTYSLWLSRNVFVAATALALGHSLTIHKDLLDWRHTIENDLATFNLLCPLCSLRRILGGWRTQWDIM
uniref:Uncharacterized protein n=1 Tax=Pyxicephalus adspersus TaxID=30357 RepID=A0AAV3AXU0_PYXAD|nr:TPA: hypothetical protein GDO54_008086 [Pyxicephalus adspersus]